MRGAVFPLLNMPSWRGAPSTGTTLPLLLLLLLLLSLLLLLLLLLLFYNFLNVRDLLEKLIIAEMFKKFPAFLESEVSLPCSQQPATGPYPEPHASSPQVLTLFRLTSILILSSHLRLGLPIALSPLGFPT
jgi:hypothetical protein